jgi:tocopherol cyclase
METKPPSWYSTLHPAMYHGHGKHPPFFEGWYHKLVSADEEARYAIIPGVILGAKGHAFIQVLDGVNARSAYHSFPITSFRASLRDYQLNIANNQFDNNGFSIDVDTPAGQISGSIRFDQPRPWPVTIASPGIMGWYAWMPRMECYHGVLSFDHGLSGSLVINGKSIDFSGGRGYMEKDWGAAFPEGYVWMQTNHFEERGSCLTASVAIIPWLRTAFPGFIVGLWLNGELHKFATYSGAKLEKIEITNESVLWVVRDRNERIEMIATRAEGGLLQGPTRLEMGKRVNETLNGTVQLMLSDLHGNKIFEGTGRHAGLEVFQAEHLLKLLQD